MEINLNNKKVLIVCLDNLGDMVMSTCLVEPLKKRFPSVGIYFWVKEHLTDILRSNNMINGVFGASPFWTGSPNRPSGTFSKYVMMLAEIRAHKFDLCIIVNADWRKAFSLAFIPKRIGVKQKKSGFFLTSSLGDGKIEAEHRSYAYRLILKELGIDVDGLRARIEPPQRLKRFADDFSRRHSLNGRNVFVLQALSGDKKRDWNASGYRELAGELIRIYGEIRIIVFFGPGEEKKINDAFSGISNVIMEKSSILEMAAVLGRVSLYLGPDSGPTHLANALGVPVVAYYAVYHSSKFAPFGSGSKAVIDIDKMSDLKTGDMLDAVKKLEHIWKDRKWK